MKNLRLRIILNALVISLIAGWILPYWQTHYPPFGSLPNAVLMSLYFALNVILQVLLTRYRNHLMSH
jgi:hypothetical protein